MTGNVKATELVRGFLNLESGINGTTMGTPLTAKHALIPHQKHSVTERLATKMQVDTQCRWRLCLCMRVSE